MKLSYIIFLPFILLPVSVQATIYAGFSLGYADHDLAGVEEPLTAELTLGKKLDESLSLEMSRIDFGHADTIPRSVTYISVRTTTFAPRLTHHLSPQFSVFGKAGLHSWDLEINDRGFTAFSESGRDLFYVAGIKWQMSQSTSLSIGLSSYTLDDDSIDHRFLGLTTEF